MGALRSRPGWGVPVEIQRRATNCHFVPRPSPLPSAPEMDPIADELFRVSRRRLCCNRSSGGEAQNVTKFTFVDKHDAVHCHEVARRL